MLDKYIKSTMHEIDKAFNDAMAGGKVFFKAFAVMAEALDKIAGDTECVHSGDATAAIETVKKMMGDL